METSKISTTVRKVRDTNGTKNPRMERKIHGTNHPCYEMSTNGMKRLRYEKSGSPINERSCRPTVSYTYPRPHIGLSCWFCTNRMSGSGSERGLNLPPGGGGVDHPSWPCHCCYIFINMSGSHILGEGIIEAVFQLC